MRDEDIIRLFNQRSEQAISELDCKYGDRCFGVINNIVKDEEDAKEGVNDTYLAMWNSIPPQTPDSLPAYMIKLARNIAFDKLDSKSALKRGMDKEVLVGDMNNVLSSQDMPHEYIQEQELARIVTGFLRGLDYEERNIFLRKYMLMEANVEIARYFAISPARVKYIVYKVRRKLEKHLRKEGYSYE